MKNSDYQREHDDPYAAGQRPVALDRRRVIHSAAFRRLQYKTQVFTSEQNDHFRTRLTHTLEVADVARALATMLALDAELAEVVALAHDLGHPPFGHAGEQALAKCMEARGGFEHNVQSLRVVEYLEHPYPEFRGLNLTRIVRECLAKHETRYDKPGRHPLQDGRRGPLEGQVVDLADRIAYGLHDLQDGLHAGLIEPVALEQVESMWHGFPTREPAADRAATSQKWHARLRPVMDHIQGALLDDAAIESRRRQESLGVHSNEQARDAAETIVDLSPEMNRRLGELDALLRDQLYRHHRIVQMDARGRRIVTDLFDDCAREPGLMPRRFSERVKEQGRLRVAADYVAGMTDRYCMQAHARLGGKP